MSTTEEKYYKSQRKLKNFWINPEFQKKYVKAIFLVGMVLALLNSAVFYFFTRENYTLLVDLSPMTDEVKQQLYSELRWILFFLLAGNGVFLSLVTLLGVVFSHRAAGPMFNLVKTCQKIRDGQTDVRVKFRPGDDFPEVANAVNEMLDALAQNKR